MKQFKINKNFTNRSEESLDRYLVEISRMPMITPEKEVELAQTIRNGGKKGEEAKEKLLQYSETHQQKASKSMAMNAGNRIDIKADTVKVN